MSPTLVLYALGVWVALLVAAVINGLVREAVIEPALGEHPAHVVSTVILVGVVLAGSYLLVSNLGAGYSAYDLLAVGALWVALTVLFEFGFGHYVAGTAWSSLLADYDVTRGRIWVLVLLAELLGPPLLGLAVR